MNALSSIHFFLTNNFFISQGLPMEEMNEEDVERKKQFESLIQEFERDWMPLASSFKKNNVDITMLSCQDDEEKAFTETTKKMEG